MKRRFPKFKRHISKRTTLMGIGLALFSIGALLGSGVLSSPADRVARDLRRHFRQQPQVTVEVVGSLIAVEGTVATLEQLRRAERTVSDLNLLGEKSGLRVSSRVLLSEEGRHQVAEKMEREIGSPEVTVRVMGDGLLLEGTVDSEFEGDRAVELVKTRTIATRGVAAAFDDDAIQGHINGPTPVATTWPDRIVDLMRIRKPSSN